MKTEKPTKAICPKTRVEDMLEYLTKGKTYDIIQWDESGTMFYITDNSGEVLNCLTDNCSHIYPKKWELS